MYVKCAIPLLKFFPSIPGFNPAFRCSRFSVLIGFAPWGFDYCEVVLWGKYAKYCNIFNDYFTVGYIELSGKMVAKLAGGVVVPWQQLWC